MARSDDVIDGGVLPPLIGRRYDRITPLAEGGMGAVYRAFDRQLGREVALKVIRRIRFDQSAIHTRFRREATYLAAVRHPNIVRIYDFEVTAGIAFLSMELIDGPSLAEVLATGALEVREALRVTALVADALATVHKQGILHRDVKPHNVVMAPDGVPKLTDFGLARLTGDDAPTAITESGQLIGTFGYVAPEVVRGDEPTVRSDVYSLGVLLYECLTAVRPRTKDEVLAYLGGKLRPEPVPPSHLARGADRALDAVVLKTLALEPEARYGAVDDVRAALESWLGRRVVTAPTGAIPAIVLAPSDPGPAARTAPRRRSRRPVASAAFALGAAGALLGLGFATGRLSSSRGESPRLPAGPPPTVELRAGLDRVEASFVTGTERRFAWKVALARSRAVLAAGQEPTPRRTHALAVDGLTPLTSYVLRLQEGERSIERAFETTTPVREPGVFVAANKGRLALQAAFEAPRADREVEVRDADGGDAQITRLPAGPGPWIVPCPTGASRATAWRWTLKERGVELAAGTASAGLELAEPPVPSWSNRGGRSTYAEPLGGPTWLGDQFLITDLSGTLTCWEPVRARAPRPPATVGATAVWSFAFVPPGQPPLGPGRAVAGLVAVDDHRVLLAAQLAQPERLALWVLDVPARCRAWRDRGGPRSGVLPGFVEDPSDPWCRPLAPGESMDVIALEGPATPVEDAVFADGVAVLPLGRTAPRWLCWDVAGRRQLWLRAAPASMRLASATPPLRLGDVPVSLRFGDLYTQGAAWGTMTAPLLAGDRLYTRLGYAVGQGQYQPVLASFPLRRPPEDGTDVWLFHHRSAPGKQRLEPEEERRSLWLAEPERVLRFEAGAREPSEVVTVPRDVAVMDGFVAYLSGPVLRRGSTRYLTRIEAMAVVPGAPTNIVGFSTVRLLKWADGQALPVPYWPPVLVEPASADQAHCIQDAVLRGNLLVGSTTLSLFVVDLDLNRAGSWCPGWEFTSRWSLGPGGLMAVTGYRGGVTVLPPQLLVEPAGQPLAPLLSRDQDQRPR